LHHQRRGESFRAIDKFVKPPRAAHKSSHYMNFSERIFLRKGRSRSFTSPTCSACHRITCKVAKEKKVVLVVFFLSAAARRRLPQYLAPFSTRRSFLRKYAKWHYPDDPLYTKILFHSGDLGFPNFETQYGKIACRFAGTSGIRKVPAVTALSGAQVIFYPTGIGGSHEKAEFGAAQLDAWKTIQRAHAIANGFMSPL